MRLALFDIDGTLLIGPSSERRFYLQLLRTGNQGPQQLLSGAWFALRWSWRFGRHVFKKDKAYLVGLEVNKIEEMANDWVATALVDDWCRPCVQRLRMHQDAGDRVVLLSGSPDFICRAIAARLGVAEWIGSCCPQKQGYFARGLPPRHPFGAEKLQIASALCACSRIAPADVVAYANSCHDLDLLEWAGTAVAVQPDPDLSAAALARGWEILGCGVPGRLRDEARAH